MTERKAVGEGERVSESVRGERVCVRENQVESDGQH